MNTIKKIHPVSDQPARFCRNAKAHKFEHSGDMMKEKIKFRSIIV